MNCLLQDDQFSKNCDYNGNGHHVATLIMKKFEQGLQSWTNISLFSKTNLIVSTKFLSYLNKRVSVSYQINY